MNTRLQVEHPVTEAVTGVDLVRAQIAIACGEALPWPQEALSQRGHAIECRVYAEDPASGFLPQAGPLLLYREPSGPGLRVDSGVVEGGEVTVHYDPLLAKIVAHGETRAAAIDRAVAALRTYPVLGVRTNISFLIRVLTHPEFRAGRARTDFIDAEIGSLIGRAGEGERIAALAAAAAFSAECEAPVSGAAVAPNRSPWTMLRGFRL
jgi:acetyl/propionyl-CoA carboxylase alpha subunit